MVCFAIDDPSRQDRTAAPAHDATTGAQRARAASLAALTRRIDAEYRDMPGLTLTASQAARLFGLQVDACREVLQALVSSGRLRHTADDRYCAMGTLERAVRTTR